MNVLSKRVASGHSAQIPNDEPIEQAARNLLINCAELQHGNRVVILAEDPALGWYDGTCPEITARVATELGATVEVLPIGSSTETLGGSAQSACEGADIRIYFARIGDRSRFGTQPSRGITVIVYARTAATFGSEFGIRPHGEMLVLKDRANAALFSAREIRITCPLGTSVAGAPPAIGAEPEDVTVRRFPMCMPAPMPAAGFSGKVALTGFLTPTGSREYEPASLKLEPVTFAHIKNGRISDFEGDAAKTGAIRKHYKMVSDRFGIDAGIVHSWHAGIHSGCRFDGMPADNPDLWSNSVFGHPGYLHFHTCGDYAPGEIAWMIAEPTIVADDEVLWSNGRLLVR